MGRAGFGNVLHLYQWEKLPCIKVRDTRNSEMKMNKDSASLG